MEQRFLSLVERERKAQITIPYGEHVGRDCGAVGKAEWQVPGQK